MQTDRWVRWLKVLCSCTAVAIACAPGDRPPAAPSRGTLSPGAERGPAIDSAPFGVVFAAPQGEATSAAELSLVFNRPLRKLETAEEAPPPPVSIQPPMAGQWLWVGSKALRFVPQSSRGSQGLPGATRYVVEVGANTRALDGSLLGKPYRFEFATPRPKIVSQEPYDGAEGLPLDQKIVLEWNQPVDPVALQKGATLVAIQGKSAGKPVRFTVARAEPTLTKKVVITPGGKLPKDAAIEFRVPSNFTGQEGPLPVEKPLVVAYRTYGALRVQSFDCDKETPHGYCAAGGTLGISLTNAVKNREFARALTVTPPVAFKIGSGGDGGDELTAHISIVGKFEPGNSYTLSVAPGLVDEHGQTLAAAYAHTFKIDDYYPYAQLGISGDTLLPSQARPIEIGSVNVPNFELFTAPLDAHDVSDFVGNGTDDEKLDALSKLKQTTRRKVVPAAARNTMSREPIVLADALGKTRGVLAMGIRYGRDKRDYRSPRTFHLLKVTDLAVSAKLSRHGSLVWVTRLDTGAPVEGATVEVRVRGDVLGQTFKTDAQGIAKLPGDSTFPTLGSDVGATLVVRKGDDWTFESFESYLSPWRLPVPMDVGGKQREYGLLFAERGVYRPGETVRLKGIVRQETPTGNDIPAGQKLTFVLSSPDGEKVSELKVSVSRYGTVSADLKIPATAPVGQWHAALLAPDGYERVASEYFDVSEYRASEFKVTADGGAPSYVRGGSAGFTVRADYLFGAPMPNAKVRYFFTRAPAPYEPPGTEGFTVDATQYYSDLPDSSMGAGSMANAEAQLDAKGTLALKEPLPMPGQRGTEVVRLDAEVTDVSRQSISSSASALVHPADFYVGLGVPEEYFVVAPGDVTPKVIAVTADGKRLAGKKVSVALVHRKWTNAREATPDGQSRYVSKVVDTVVSACDLTTTAGPQGCKVHAAQTGYYVVVAESKDARGNPVKAAYGFYATGSAPGASFSDSDEALVGLVTNKKQYSVGDTAKVLVKSPFAVAEALVTVERAGVYRSEKVTLRGPASTVSVPITDDLRPNAFVSVHLLRSAKVKGVGPLYRVGYADLRIDPEARRLAVEVKPNKREYRPGEEVSVDLTVKSAGGKPASAELTVYAVDEGVLMLTGYRTPDPIPVFTAARPLQVATLETRESMAKITLADFVMATSGDKGEEGGGGGQSIRQDFKTTAFFDPHVVADANGRASVKFKLPDNLTTFRVMAVASAETDRYGFGSAILVTSKKLMARPNLPRFLRTGDRAEAGIVVSSKGLQKAQIKVQASATGVALEGAPERTIELTEKGSVEVRFPFVAGAPGPARFRFAVSGAGETDTVEVLRTVQVPSKLETVALYGSTNGVSAESMGDYSSVRRDIGDLEVKLSSSALVGLDGSAASLVHYQYECTEQLSSRLLPLVPLRELSERFGFQLPPNAPVLIGSTIRDILSRQRSDGGFGMWPESPRSEPFVSAYATWALHEAKASGQPIPRVVMDRAHQYLRHALAATHPDRFVGRANAAMMVDVLATTGSPDPGYMGRLFEERKNMPPFARAFLLHALAVGKGPAANVETLAAELSSELRIANDAAFAAENVGDEYASILDSQARTTALVLRALISADPGHALVAPLARGLLSLRQNGTWRSTQESAYSLVALDAYWRAREKHPGSFTAKVWLGDDSILSAAFDGKLTSQQATVPLSRISDRAGDLVFQKQGPGTLFYEARLHYARKALPTAPLDAGFFVQKALRAVDPASLPKAIESVASTGVTTFKAGDLVLVDLVVVTPSPRQYVVLDDPLPAGFEAVDTGLSTTASWLDVPGSSGADPSCYDCEDDGERDLRAHGRAFGWSWFRRETRDDRVVFFVDHMAAGMYHYRYLARATTYGSFVLPPTQAEEMYTPETFGRTGAASIVVQ